MWKVIFAGFCLSLIMFGFAFAETVNGKYPICETANNVNDFNQAKMFNDYKKMEKLLSDGKCQFVEPDIECAVVDRAMTYKVLVFVPYRQPITGYTDPANLR